MTETIESFVTKLRTEGIQQGKQEAEQIRGESRKEADLILSEAKAQAEKIIADANSEAKLIISRSRTELELASRDAILKLRDSLEQVLQSVLMGPVEEILSDDSFLKELIKTVMDRFLSAAMTSSALVEINVSPEMKKKLANWAINELRMSGQNKTSGFDFHSNLREAGFEFTVNPGATIEITQDSVLATLMSMVSPSLRDIISSAAREK